MASACIAPEWSVSSSTPVSGAGAGPVSGKCSVNPVAVKLSGCGSALPSTPWALGKKRADVTCAAPGPVTARVPSGARMAGKGDGTMDGGGNRACSAEAPPARLRENFARSGTQISEQTSQDAVAETLPPTPVAVNGSTTWPEST